MIRDDFDVDEDLNAEACDALQNDHLDDLNENLKQSEKLIHVEQNNRPETKPKKDKNLCKTLGACLQHKQ
jgi:hypothetical protein